MILIVAKVLIASLLISFCSWLAGKSPTMAGFIIALPLTSVLAILFTYWQYRDIQKINEFATSILVSVPLSLFFFLPFVLNRWLKLNFIFSFGLGLSLLWGAYFFHQFIIKKII